MTPFLVSLLRYAHLTAIEASAYAVFSFALLCFALSQRRQQESVSPHWPTRYALRLRISIVGDCTRPLAHFTPQAPNESYALQL